MEENTALKWLYGTWCCRWGTTFQVVQGKSGHIGVDFVYHGIRVPDCAVEMLGERRGVKKLDRKRRKSGLALR